MKQMPYFLNGHYCYRTQTIDGLCLVGRNYSDGAGAFSVMTS